MAEAQRQQMAQALIGQDRALMALYIENAWFKLRVDTWIEMFIDLVPALAMRAEEENQHYQEARRLAAFMTRYTGG